MLPNSALSTRYSVLVLILLAAVAIQFHALARDVRFYPDEALFSTFARNAALDGAWLLPGALDKPPLAIYANALSMQFVASGMQNGVLDFDPRLGEFAARLPGALASIVLVAVTYALAQRLYRRRALSAWAAIFVAFSPFTAIYGASAYTDPLMLTFAALALLLVARDRWLASGIALALAFGSKQQAIFALPLVLLIGWLLYGISARRLIAFVAPLIAGVVLLVGWDALRAQPDSIWTLALANNRPDSLIPAEPITARLSDWFGYARNLLGTPTILFGAGALLMLGWRVARQRSERMAQIDILLAVYLLAYLLVHVLFAFNVYPRYLLPLIVPAALLSARALLWLWSWLILRINMQEAQLLAGGLVLTLAVTAWNAGTLPGALNEDLRDYSGITTLANYLNGQTLGAVVYDRWLGWELGYYMGQWTDKRRVYYPTPDELVAGALELDDPAPRYLVAPASQPVDDWLDALRAAGFTVEQDYLAEGFVVYRLTPPWAA